MRCSGFAKDGQSPCRRRGVRAHAGGWWCERCHPPSIARRKATAYPGLLYLCHEAAPLCSPEWREQLAKIEASVSGEVKP